MILQEVLDFISKDKGALTGVIAHIQTTDEGKELLTNHANAHFEQEIKPRIAKVYSDLDNDILGSLGESRPNDVKTYEFIKQKMSELKKLKESKGGDKEGKIKELEKQIETLKAEGGQNEYWKKTHNEAVSKWDTERSEFENQINTLKTEQLQSQVSGFLNSGLTGLEFSIPQEAVDAMKQLHSNSVIKNAKIVDGKVVLHNEDGNPMLNSQYKPMTAKEYWETKLASVIKKPEQGGGGAPAEKKGNIVTVGEGDKAKKKLVLDSSAFSTKLEFNKTAAKALTAQGIERNSADWNQLVDGAYAEYDVSKLPLQ
ncbi:hypothetical protein [Tenacibaculum sp. C7A-26P2]|uniref:hypothetical protein n=1 Tax=Tenacibaculum sp. C7A-26P2 TaxID=3447504 RepID=UPI003F85CC9B